MWNKILNTIKNWWKDYYLYIKLLILIKLFLRSVKEKPKTQSIEERIKNSKDYQNRYGG